MQIVTQFLKVFQSTESNVEAQSVLAKPVELNSDALDQVGGGMLPNGTWSQSSTSLPNGSW